MRREKKLATSRAACALALSCILAVGPLVDGLGAGRAFAAEPEPGAAPPAASAEPQDPANEPAQKQEDAGSNESHLSQDVPLAQPDAPAEPAGSGANAPAQPDGAASNAQASGAGSVAPPSFPQRVSESLPLVDDAPAASAGVLVLGGLAYAVNADGATAKLVGWHDQAPEGAVTVAARVVSGADVYDVTSVEKRALAGCDRVTSVTLPETLAEIGEGAFDGCTKLEVVEVAERNQKFASRDGMLFTAGLAQLLVCPAGKGASGGGRSLTFPRKPNR